MALSTYGKGYLLTAHSSHPQYAKYYYYDTHGFTDTPKKMEHLHTQDFGILRPWMVFQEERFRIFDYECGAKFIKDEPTTSASSFTMSDDLIINDSYKVWQGIPIDTTSGDG